MKKTIVATILLSAFAIHAQSIPAKIAIVYNQTSSGTESSNPDFMLTKNTIDWAILKLVDRRKVEIKFFDSKDTAVGTYQTLKEINSYNPKVVVGFGHSYQAILAKKELKNSIKLISPVATSDEILSNSHNMYLLSNTNSVQAKKILDEIKKSALQLKIVLVKISDSLYSSNFIERIILELDRNNIKFNVISINQNDLMSSTILTKKLSSLKEHDTIVFPCLEYDSGLFLKVLSKNYNSFNLIGTDGWGTTGSYIKSIDLKHDQKVSWFTNYHYKNLSEGNSKFLKEFRLSFSQNPIDTNAFWFESIRIANLMVTTKSQWKDSLKNFESVTKIVKIKDYSVERKMSRLSLKDKSVVYEGDF